MLHSRETTCVPDDRCFGFGDDSVFRGTACHTRFAKRARAFAPRDLLDVSPSALVRGLPVDNHCAGRSQIALQPSSH